jgi:putative transposase
MTPRTKRGYLKQLVSGKNEWSRRLTDEERKLGFLGWHERGYLPHCDFPDLVQLVTFRLRDSMPASRRVEWEFLLKIEDVRDRRIKLEEYLDKGIGCCRLRDPVIAELAEITVRHFHLERYELLGWVIMPNHMHVLLNVWQTPLSKIIQSWKRFIATGADGIFAERRPPARHERKTNLNAPARRAALQWQREYWDTFMRDEEQQGKAIAYIENNPVKARLCRAPENWPFSSARFRDKFHQLNISSKEIHRG